LEKVADVVCLVNIPIFDLIAALSTICGRSALNRADAITSGAELNLNRVRTSALLASGGTNCLVDVVGIRTRLKAPCRVASRVGNPRITELPKFSVGSRGSDENELGVRERSACVVADAYSKGTSLLNGRGLRVIKIPIVQVTWVGIKALSGFR
jgi:hypothetical protein